MSALLSLSLSNGMSLIDAIAVSHQDQRLGTEGTCKVKK